MANVVTLVSGQEQMHGKARMVGKMERGSGHAWWRTFDNAYAGGGNQGRFNEEYFKPVALRAQAGL